MADKNMEAQISVEFEEATSRQSLNSGETINTLWSKVKRWLSDLKVVCFSGSYNDLSDTPTTATTDTDGLMSAADKTKLDSADDTYALKSKYGDTTINVGRKDGSDVGEYSTAEGSSTTASGYASHAEGSNADILNGEIAFYNPRTVTISDDVTVEVDSSQAYGINSHAEGCQTLAYGKHSHAEGDQTTAKGGGSHAEGYKTIASGAQSHAEGVATTASGGRSHAEGSETIASGGSNHAEGKETTANGNNSCHAEGQLTTASGIATHAEGSSSNKVTDLITDFSWNGTTNDDIINAWNTQKFSVAHGRSSHVEGSDNLSLGHSSHAEGHNTIAIGNQSHTSGISTKALHDNEAAYGKYNESNEDTLFSIGDGTADDARHNAFEITTTGGKLHDKNIVTDDMSLPANGGNADTVDGRHCGRIATLDSNGNYWSSKVEDINDAYLQWDGSKYFRLKTYGENLTHVDNSDTVDGLHADDFVNATNRSQIQIPNNVDVPVWIHTNGKRFQRYTTNSGNIGLTNVPDNSTDYVWYWYDGFNILARDYSSGKYYICDMINGYFSGWKDVYTSRYKPYVTGEVTGTSGSAIITTNHGFTPSAVFWWMISQGRTLHSAHSFDTTSFTLSSSLTSDALVNYIIFR